MVRSEYRRRRPEDTVLYRTVREHLATFLDVASRRGGMKSLGSFVAMNCLLYGAGRFAPDFLRAKDRADADPAHYCSHGIFVFGIVVAILARARKLEDRCPVPGTKDQVPPAA